MFSLVLVAAATIAAATSQEFDLSRIRACAKAEIEWDCSNFRSGIMGVVVSALQCNRTDFALESINYCARSGTNGNYCGLLNFHFGEVLNLLVNSTLCAPVVYGGGACSSQCAAGLRMLRDDFGCCINAYFNGTDTIFEYFRELFSYRVWSACNVPPVTETCTPIIDLKDIQVVANKTCTYKEIQTVIWSSFCTADAYEKTRDQVQRTEVSCDAFLAYHRDLCSIDAKNNFCYSTDSSNYDYVNYLMPLFASCANQGSTCNDSCRDVLNRFQADRGCCINAFFNSTLARVDGAVQPLLMNDSLFTLCGVTPPPDECKLPFTIASGSLPLKSLNILFLFSLVVYVMSQM